MHARTLTPLLATLVLFGCKDPVDRAVEKTIAETVAEQSYSTVDELGKAVFEALKAQDAAAYERCVATEEDLEFVIGKMNIPDEEMRKEVVADLREDAGEARKSLESITRAAKNSGVDISQATFESMDYNVGESGGLTGSDPTLLINHGDKTYIIRMNNCIKAESGWKVFDEMRWSGEE